MAKVKVFDTTLRDGEQSPGFTMSIAEKLRMAMQLDDLGVDIIEAGFSVASDDDFSSVSQISKEVRRPIIAALARANPKDVEIAGKSVQSADKPRIHTFIATSDIHLTKKLEIGQEECLERITEAVRLARKLVDDVEFSAEDATRTDIAFLCEAIRAALSAGATTINIPDTVGYTFPEEFSSLITTLYEEIPGLDNAVVSVHCHDDMGLAVANSLAAIQAGARQVECTINGIGERAGNASLEEIVMALKVRKDLTEHYTDINSESIYKTSQLLSHITGIDPQPNKAIVGQNAFSHEAGIHQHGMLKDKITYEIMMPELVGAPGTQLVLGKHSGRHGLNNRYQELGYELTKKELDRAYTFFTILADQKKDVLDEDLLLILRHGAKKGANKLYKLLDLVVTCGNELSTAKVNLSFDDITKEGVAEDHGPINATFSAIDNVIAKRVRIEGFEIVAATPGRDAVGVVNVKVLINEKSFAGKGASTDIVNAAARAYIDAINKSEQLESTYLNSLAISEPSAS
tara:strand:- start:347 stop:1897 length:1551 start_codon:yes stop_codon:yes gene_type:complete